MYKMSLNSSLDFMQQELTRKFNSAENQEKIAS